MSVGISVNERIALIVRSLGPTIPRVFLSFVLKVRDCETSLVNENGDVCAGPWSGCRISR